MLKWVVRAAQGSVTAGGRLSDWFGHQGAMRDARVKWRLLLLLVTVVLVRESTACCPNSCSGHGVCTSRGNGCICSCFRGYAGGDCSRRDCPMGPAWNDIPIATDLAHQPAVCSNRGICDFTTGKCTCDAGFTGPACNRLSCPSDCTKQGECRSMRLHAARKDRGFPPALKYETNWDADMVHGCSCSQGYLGGDCSKRQCPTGDDPLTGAATDVLFGFQKNEKQTVYCSATSGTLTLSFLGQTTVLINAADKVDVVSAKINALSTIRTGGASVTFGGTRTTVCAADGTFTTVEFTQDFGMYVVAKSFDLIFRTETITNLRSGSLPLLVPDGSKLVHAAVGSTPTLTVTRSDTCSKENDVCSNRGRCDQASGVCTCFTGFLTSGGDGKRGDRGDCGATETTITACPGETECSGHGYCTGAPQFRCMCVDGYTSGDCSVRTCPKGIAWFDQPLVSDNAAHTYAECSNIGVCDLARGECVCPSPFTGAACERMRCPPGDENQCNGHGRCMTMAELAGHARTVDGDPLSITYGATPNKPSTWDFNKILGCICDAGFEGHDCSRRSCPRGDDPRTTGQSREVQTISCTHSATTTFMLSFRGSSADTISSSATVAQFQAALSAVSRIGAVRVTYSTGASLCTSAGPSNLVSITFIDALGDLPPLRLVSVSAAASALLTSFSIFTDGVSGSVRGTNENAECSNSGLCDYSTGICACFEGMVSSDGNGNLGLRMDCGYILPVEDPLAKNLGLVG